MSFTELSHNQLVLISKLTRLIKQETGIFLKLNDDNLFDELHSLVSQSQNPAIKETYEKLLEETGLNLQRKPDSISATETGATKKRVYRGQVIDTSDSNTSAAAKDTKKRVYRGQVIDD